MGEVDAAFIQEAEHRPNPEIIKAEGIPLIDLSHASTEVRHFGHQRLLNETIPII